MRRSSRSLLAIAALLGILPGGAAPCLADPAADRPSEEEIGSVEVYLTPEQAVREIFGEGVRVDSVTTILTPGEVAEIRERSHAEAVPDTVILLVVRGTGDGVLGYALEENETGKYRPITFLVGMTPEGKVKGVEVLVYRESRGGEVRRSRFLRQYRDKGADDAIRLNRDIINVAGATLSVRAMNRGVKAALVTREVLARRNEP